MKAIKVFVLSACLGLLTVQIFSQPVTPTEPVPTPELVVVQDEPATEDVERDISTYEVFVVVLSLVAIGLVSNLLITNRADKAERARLLNIVLDFAAVGARLTPTPVDDKAIRDIREAVNKPDEPKAGGAS
jgi:hypothetical protein